ncbi:hypothetical protein H5079_14120 [Pseudoalteromonas sp. SG44-5]|uniref:hypothetical protein n=1 Tax=Pseudoalteromonas sp. SG44-5 TaxID=2760960 RepID=UPI0015FD6919|nr:hypothetical protein [Pseudoalteromonas sp. SG44-5]MBB1406732.1 hypothetical protein [Pseudoalteromonas sp. SG44-5]
MEINYLKLYFALTLTGLTIWGADESLDAYRAYVIEQKALAYAKQLEIETKSLSIRAQTRALKLKSELAESSRKERQLDAARKTNREICTFWTNEYNEIKSDRNQAMMQGACERARKN